MEANNNNNNTVPATTSSNATNTNIHRRRSSIFPQYLRRKSQRKDSIFASESTVNLWPIKIADKQPDLLVYAQEAQNSKDISFKFGWVNGVYVGPCPCPLSVSP